VYGNDEGFLKPLFLTLSTLCDRLGVVKDARKMWSMNVEHAGQTYNAVVVKADGAYEVCFHITTSVFVYFCLSAFKAHYPRVSCVCIISNGNGTAH
jgi:hypothetical protein